MHEAGGVAPPRADVVAHLRRFLGPSPGPLVVAGDVEVHAFGPTHPRPWLTLATLGLSGRDLTPPADDPDRRHQELLLYLPADWDVASDDPAVRWPMQLLLDLAAYLEAEGSAPEPGRSVALHWPPEPFGPGTILTAATLNPPGREDPGFDPFFVGVHAVRFLWVIPITTAEHALLTREGYDALLQRMGEARVPYELDAGRACLVTGRRPRPVAVEPEPIEAEPAAASRRRRRFGR